MVSTTPVKNTRLVRVFVADSSRMHTELIGDALRHDSQLDVIKWDSDRRTVVNTLLSSDVDVLIISATINGLHADGLDIVRQMQTLRPEIRAVVLLDSNKSASILDAFRAGAKGVFSRDGCPEMLGKCVHCVSQGQIWANNHEMAVAVGALSAVPRIQSVDAKGFELLSQRELEVVNRLAQGLTNREIAERLGLSQHTIKNYVFKIFDKLGVSSRIELLFMTLNQPDPTESVLEGAGKGLSEGLLSTRNSLAHRRSDLALSADSRLQTLRPTVKHQQRRIATENRVVP